MKAKLPNIVKYVKIMSYQNLSVSIVKKQRKRLKVTLVITIHVRHILMFKREQGQTYCIIIQKTDQGGTEKSCKVLLWNVYSIANDEKLSNFIQIIRGHEYQHYMCH